jgi:hypothetical protein
VRCVCCRSGCAVLSDINPQCGAKLFHGLLTNLAHMPRPFGQGGPHQVGLALELTASVTNRFEEPIECVDELALDFDVAHLPDDVALFELLYLGCIEIECIVVLEDRVALHMAWVCRAQATGIGEHAHDFPGHRRGVVFQVDGVPARLAHFGLAVDPHQARYPPHQRPWFWEEWVTGR